MTEREILEIFKYRYLNLKTNNYIFCEVNDFKILDNIPNICGISIEESSLDIDYALNVKIDLKEVNVRDILSYTLQLLKNSSLLDVTLDYTLEFNNKFDLLKFQNVLHNYGIVVQFIFFNIEKLDIEDQMLFNEIYYFNSIFFNANSFIKNDNFQSYFLSNERVLDNRENYTKIKVINTIMPENNEEKCKLQKKLDFNDTFIKKYMNQIFSKDIIPSKIKKSIKEMKLTEKSLQDSNKKSSVSNIDIDLKTALKIILSSKRNNAKIELHTFDKMEKEKAYTLKK